VGETPTQNQPDLWFVPCPEGFDIGPWREACAEIAKLCDDKVIPFHNEDLKRLLRQATEAMKDPGTPTG
jgi:hypothetical protein